MNPRDFHSLANHLARGSAADIRTSISRSYYAAFHVGAAALRTIGVNIGRGAAAHGEVVHCLGNSGQSQLTLLAFVLSDLHTVRNRADYQLDKADVEQSAKAVAIATQAESFIQSLDQIFSGPDRESIRQAISTWRKANGYP
jgi:uncharacterized protein (UPF0332 family)